MRLYLSVPLDQVMGWVLDYGNVKACFQSLYRQLNRRLLNELLRLGGTDPVSPARWLHEAVVAQLPQLDHIDLQEPPGCGVLLCRGDPGLTLPS